VKLNKRWSAIITTRHREAGYRPDSPLAVRSGMVYLSGEVRLGGRRKSSRGSAHFDQRDLKAGGSANGGITRRSAHTPGEDGSVQTIVADYDKITKSGEPSSIRAPGRRSHLHPEDFLALE